MAAVGAHVTHSPTPSALRHGCGGRCRLAAPLLARLGAARQRAAHQGLRAPRHHHLLQGTARPEGAAGLSGALGEGGCGRVGSAAPPPRAVPRLSAPRRTGPESRGVCAAERAAGTGLRREESAGLAEWPRRRPGRGTANRRAAATAPSQSARSKWSRAAGACPALGTAARSRAPAVGTPVEKPRSAAQGLKGQQLAALCEKYGSTRAENCSFATGRPPA